MSAFDICYENWWFFDKIFGKSSKRKNESRQKEKMKNKKLTYFWSRKILIKTSKFDF